MKMVEDFEAEVRKYGRELGYKFPLSPFNTQYYPGKYFKLVNTVADRVPVQTSLPL